MGDIILIKPASSDFKEQNRLLGNLDIPVSDSGRETMEELIRQIRDNHVEILYSCPSDPCKTTSETIAEELDIPLKEKSSLENLNLGLWQGLQIEEIRRKQPKVFKQWIENPETICPPEGESVEEAVKRIKKTVAKIKKRKECCGIIVSEPLASLIRSYLQKSDLSFQPLVKNDAGITIEKIYSDSSEMPGKKEIVNSDSVNREGEAGE